MGVEFVRKLWRGFILGLKNFGSMPKPTKAAIKAAFTKVDKDGTGKLAAGQVKKMLIELGDTPSEEGFKYFMALADKDGDKMVNYQEVIDAFYKELDMKTYLSIMFKIYDADGNGKLSRKEIAQMEGAMTSEDSEEEEVDDVLEDGDTDGDGMISFDEYCKMYNL